MTPKPGSIPNTLSDTDHLQKDLNTLGWSMKMLMDFSVLCGSKTHWTAYSLLGKEEE